MSIGKEIRSLYERTPDADLGSYLTSIANMGFQIYAVNDRLEGTFYGAPFKHPQIDEAVIRSVLAGEPYRGDLERKQFLKVIGYFENSVKNSVGLPVSVKGQPYALFVRPNLEEQIGEVRVLIALLLGVTFVISIGLIAIFARTIVKPVKKLTAATHQIVRGDYRIELEVTRRDEIGNLARDFTQMAASLKQLDEMRQEFVANVSHEIQSPLTSIQGFAQAILDQETTPEESRRYLRIIDEESRRLSQLSKQLLTLAALDKESNVLKLTAFRLDEQLRQIVIVTERQWADKKLHIDLELPEIVVTGDYQLLYQVWMNLIANGIKFTPPGGTIGIEIEVREGIAVRIADTGIGISDEELPHIFERFYKADKARNRAHAGSGLGLAIAWKIVRLHQGTIEAKSEPGKGATFTVVLPHL